VYAVTRSDSQKQASIPKAKTIDALLDAGATILSSALNVATSDPKSMENPHAFSTAHDMRTLTAKPDPIGVNTTTAAGRRAEDKDRKLHGSKSETDRPRRDGSNKSGDKTTSVNMPNDSVDDHAQPANATKVASKVPTDRARHIGTDGADKTKMNKTTLDSGEQTVTQSPGHGVMDTGGTIPATLNTKPARSTQNQQARPAKASVNDSKGRPQRRAKQTALGKLKSNNGREDSDDDEMSDDFQDDGLDIVVQSKQTKAASGRNQKAKHLPTPVTEGNLPKKKAEANPNGKLKPVKQQQTKTTASTKTQLDQKLTQGTAAPAGNAATQEEVAGPSTGTDFTQSLPDHRRTGITVVNHNAQHETEDTPPPRRPGALKRPGKSHSRGRRPQTDTPYEVPGTSSNTRKKRRNISRASKASTTRAGPTRQRMQSESVKVRPDHVSDDPQLPSVSHQVLLGGRLRKPSVSRHKKDGSRPPPETQSRGTAKQHGSHVVPKVRSSIAAAEPQNTTTGGRKVTTQEKPGSSQAQAIMIEQDSQSGSSSSPSPQKPVNTQSKTTAQEISRPSHVGRPQTPAMIPSSPPGSGRGAVHTLAKDKPTIIAFSRQGPRNQGMSSAKKQREAAASSKVLSDYRSSKAGNPGDYEKTIGLATQLFPPSSQPSYRHSTKVKHSVDHENVAKEDESAFGDFTKAGKNRALANMLQQPSTMVNELDQEDQDNGFAVIDDFEGTTLVDDHEQPESPPKQPTASQVAMPPPNVVTRGKKNSKTARASVDLPTKTATKAVATEDTPRPAPVKKATKPPNVEQATQAIPGAAVPTVLAEDATHRSALERKISEAILTDKTSEWKPSTGRRMGQFSQQTRKRGLAEAQEDSPRKTTRVSGKDLLAVPEAKPTHAQKASELQGVQMEDYPDILFGKRSRPSRRSTRTSQGVDILGSPYPKDLEVPKQTTALEVFSQQAGLSSDQTERSDIAPTGRLDLQAISRMVPTTKVGLVSSNVKPVLAAPRERSKVVTRIASGTLAEQLLAVRSVHTSEENPFTSSRERESSAGQRPAANKFREALRQRGIDLSDRPPAVRSEELGDENFKDGEETLVEPADDLEKAKEHTASSPGVSEASRGRSPEAAANVLEDVGDWRNSLKPHQTHLFDSLVIAAHKLVRHMVDHESADRTMAEDYRRRGEIIVDELQRAHAKEYQQYAQNVQGWKIQAADELAAHGRKLKQHMRDAEKARAERKKALLARNGFDDVLEELVAGLE